MKRTHEYHEGPEAATRFRNAMKAIIAVPHSVILEREAEYKRQSEANPNRRGRKRTPKA
ncbi:MAG TPA: hypothetical protein VKB79_29145 [Bryobacteraceae bacterium]|nr:hypothetical protein [Bryobacteraceae bacterium]